MALEKQIIERLNSITNLLNEIQVNAKRTEEFPEQTDLQLDSKIRISYETISYWTTIGDILGLIGFGAFSDKKPYQIATEGQSVFNVDPNADNIDVWVGSHYQIEGRDYNRVAGVVTLIAPYVLTAGDIFSYRTYSSDSTTEQFEATEGQTVFTLSSIARSNEIHVNALYQIEGLHYNISGNTLTFTYPLTEDDIVTRRKFR